MTIGTNIKKYREIKRLSQEELAEILDVSQPVISSWESDKTNPNSAQLPRIAQALDIEIPELFKGVNSLKYVSNQNNKDHSVNGFEIKIDARHLFEEYISSLKELNSLFKEEIKSLREELNKLKKN